MSTPTAFRFRSKHVLLTYSQCGDLNAWRVNDHLGSLRAECIIGREDHVDGEFISMLSRCGNGSLRREMSVYSMWTDATRTYHLLEGHQRRLTITQLRMETWSQEDLNGRAEIAWLRLVASGLKSSLRQLETSFLNASRSWILAHYAPASPVSGRMRNGSTDPTLPSMSHLEEYRLTRLDLQHSMNGLGVIWDETL